MFTLHHIFQISITLDISSKNSSHITLKATFPELFQMVLWKILVMIIMMMVAIMMRMVIIIMIILKYDFSDNDYSDYDDK